MDEPYDGWAVRRHVRRAMIRELGQIGWGAGFFFLLIHVNGQPVAILWLLVALLLMRWGVLLHPLLTTGGRARWREEAAQQTRVHHALRSHQSIGGEDHLVTKLAKDERASALVVCIGGACVAAVVAITLINQPPAVVGKEVVIVAIIALMFGVPVPFAFPSLRRARRWLAEPPTEPR